MDDEAFDARWARWHTCRLCEQEFHGAVSHALGWACWKTYLGGPDNDDRVDAMTELGNALYAASHFEDALSVREALLSTMRRIGADEDILLDAQSNVASAYADLGQLEKALSMELKLYSDSACSSLRARASRRQNGFHISQQLSLHALPDHVAN